MQVARVQAGIDCANCTVDNSLIGISPGNYCKYRSHLCERRKVARYTPYGCTRVHNHGGSWSGYVNPRQEGHVRRTRDIMPGDKKPEPSETENKRILAVSKHQQENYEILGLKFLCI